MFGKNLTKKRSLAVIAASMLMAGVLHADCTYELFTISSGKGTTIAEFVDQLTDECAYSVIVTDVQANAILQKSLNKTHLKNLTIEEVLDLILTENNLSFTLENNVLKISYLQTKTYNIDYILSERRGVGSTDVTLSAQTASTETTTTTNDDEQQNDSQSGIKIESTDEVKFWTNLDKELERVVNRPEDEYTAELPIINKNAGMVTVTATSRQHQRLDEYLKTLQKRVKHQVLIDVHMYAVTFEDSKTTGVDWQQLYALQNFNVLSEKLITKQVSLIEDNVITEFGPGVGNANASFLKFKGDSTINEVVKFLDTQGKVHAISNPKVLTLNNQPALITVGTEYFYKIQQSSNQQGSGGGVASTTQSDIISSVFAGVLLDITPEISSDDTITLKVNPSISQTTSDVTVDSSGERSVPPDLDRRQLASVVTVKDGQRVILGGLINTRTTNKTNKVPLLGDIPGLNYLFKYDAKVKEVEELVIIIEPHIIKKEDNDISLADLGYEGITNESVKLPASKSN